MLHNAHKEFREIVLADVRHLRKLRKRDFGRIVFVNILDGGFDARIDFFRVNVHFCDFHHHIETRQIVDHYFDEFCSGIIAVLLHHSEIVEQLLQFRVEFFLRIDVIHRIVDVRAHFTAAHCRNVFAVDENGHDEFQKSVLTFEKVRAFAFCGGNCGVDYTVHTLGGHFWIFARFFAKIPLVHRVNYDVSKRIEHRKRHSCGS